MVVDLIPYLNTYLSSFDRTRRFSFGRGTTPLPSINEIEEIEGEILNLFFPGQKGIKDLDELKETIESHLDKLIKKLYKAIYLCLLYENESKDEENWKEKTKSVLKVLLEKLPELRQKLKLDAEAGYNGDPAAKGIHEVILCYPGLRAITIHRVANLLYNLSVPLLPRMLSEVAHSKTGIDIHPGARVGSSFFIDHGTGVVIGETTIIGDRVKIYQGVTLGALSFPKDGCGQLLRDIKRHPTIGNDVTIYANATILGNITIGNNSTIAASSWVTCNIQDNSRVMTEEPKIIIKQKLKVDKLK